MRSSFIVPELRVIIGNGLFVSLNLIVRLLAMFWIQMEYGRG
jgi:hypothetical protein